MHSLLYQELECHLVGNLYKDITVTNVVSGYFRSVKGPVSQLPADGKIDPSCLATLLKKLPRVSSALSVKYK